MSEVALGFSVCAILFSFGTMFFSILSYVEVLAMKKSTHKVEWVPMDDVKSDPAIEKKRKEETRAIEKYLYDDIGEY